MRFLFGLRVAIAALVVTAAACRDDGVTGISVGQLQVVIQTTGGDLDLQYELIVGDVHRGVPVNATVLLNMEPGTYDVVLTNVAGNCIVNGPSTKSATVAKAQVTVVQFTVDCAVTGVEVKAQTTGPDNPDSYTARVGATIQPVPANGTVTFGRMQPGSHNVSLELPGANCTVVGDRNVTVSVQNRSVAKVAFNVVCVPPVRRERIAYVDYSSSSEAAWQIFLINPDGSDAERLSAGSAPSWSPDGTKMVYTTTSCDYYYGCTGSLVIGDPEARNSRVLQSSFAPRSPAWAPTGDVIAFTGVTGFGQPSRLFTIGVNGTPVSTIALDSVTHALNPAWSPSGDRIAFTCVIGTASQNIDICTVNRDGSQWKRLTSSAFAESDPSWNPSGTRIAFTTFEGDNAGRIATMAPDGSEKTFLSTGFSPSWSRDGSRIIFAQADGIFTMKPDGTDVVRLTTGKHSDPVWRP